LYFQEFFIALVGATADARKMRTNYLLIFLKLLWGQFSETQFIAASERRFYLYTLKFSFAEMSANKSRISSKLIEI